MGDQESCKGCEQFGNFSSVIEEEMSKVSLGEGFESFLDFDGGLRGFGSDEVKSSDFGSIVTRNQMGAFCFDQSGVQSSEIGSVKGEKDTVDVGKIGSLGNCEVGFAGDGMRSGRMGSLKVEKNEIGEVGSSGDGIRSSELGSFPAEKIGEVGSVGDGERKSELGSVKVERTEISVLCAGGDVLKSEEMGYSGVERVGLENRDEDSVIGVDNSAESSKICAVNGDGYVNKSSGVDSDEDGSDDSSSESESESSSSSSSSPSSSSSEDDDDDKNDQEESMKTREAVKEEEEEEEELKLEMEESEDIEDGEIKDLVEEMLGGSEDDEEGGAAKGPIRSRNELEGFPPVPSVDVTLEPHHKTLPVGAVLSVIGTKVIVEGFEKHSPLSEGSILWISESRIPLGIVDEIFGPVKNPYYVVRYNSEGDVPTGTCEGTLVSFVQEFANHVLNDSNLYKKGYDASGENDEELTDEVEFSDDEKEAEYKRMQKVLKRGGTNDVGPKKQDKNKNKFQNRNVAWKTKPSVSQAPDLVEQLLQQNGNQNEISPVATPMNHSNCSSSFGTGVVPCGPGLVPQLSLMTPRPVFIPPSSGVGMNEIFCQKLPVAPFADGLTASGVPLLQPNYFQPPYHIPVSNGMPFQQQFGPNHTLPPNCVMPYGQPVFSMGQPLTPWHGFVGHVGFNQAPFQIAQQGQQAYQPVNTGESGGPSHGCSQQPRANSQQNVQGNGVFSAPRNWSQASDRGRRPPFHRGSSRFLSRGRGRGRGGRHQSN
ncbi:H/ACA ribonucleoprotein complex, subunit Gar1/Naf1 [Dillenia turbinata]|uniref:H/ACA ribonucleoprotein complex non-core subunit NAF1 n=1 Tax=Dillenia turbinata TaxID=194707 RepID=A0AAN8ULD2_9MAGN